MQNDLNSQISKAKGLLKPDQYDICKKIMSNHWTNQVKEEEVWKFYQLISPDNFMELIDIFFKIEYLEKALLKCKD